MARYKSYLKRARAVKDLVDEEYELGTNNKQLAAIWRRTIYPRYGICERAYRKMVSDMASLDGRIGKGSNGRAYPKKGLPEVYGEDPRQQKIQFD
ncbi:MAG: hypothetical protein IJT12_09175 [Paludibacteraceae bacterium]|nr:hypothetical protein [Paludibacteraceae bacterium]